MNLSDTAGAARALGSAAARFRALPALAKSDLGEHDLLVVVDMINGFCRTGNLSSPRALALAEPMQALVRDFPGKTVFLCDKHHAGSAELAIFPEHCTDNIEIMVVDELIDFAEHCAVYKNSTNGFFSFLKDIQIDKQAKSVIIIGWCTDLCVLQFALTLQAWFHECDRPLEVSVLTDFADTYDGPGHDADFFNLAALAILENSGVRLYRTIE